MAGGLTTSRTLAFHYLAESFHLESYRIGEIKNFPDLDQPRVCLGQNLRSYGESYVVVSTRALAQMGLHRI